MDSNIKKCDSLNSANNTAENDFKCYTRSK